MVFRRLLVDARGTGEPFHIVGNDYGQLHHPLAQFRVSRNVALNAIARNRVVEFPRACANRHRCCHHHICKHVVLSELVCRQPQKLGYRLLQAMEKTPCLRWTI